jgi:hypothetical protein
MSYLCVLRYLMTWVRVFPWLMALGAALLCIAAVLGVLGNGHIALDPLTYCLSALACNVLGNYFSLAAKLSQWSMFVQLITTVGMILGIGLSRFAGVLPLPVMVALLLGLSLLFRQQALQRFAVVDWHQLRPAGQTFKGKLS